MQGQGFVSRSTAIGLAVAVGALAVIMTPEGRRDGAAHASMLLKPSMTVLSQTSTSLQVEFVDGSSNSKTVTFSRADSNSPWLPVSKLQNDRGIAFGNNSPSMPTLAVLSSRQIDPATVVQPFGPDFYTGPIDDITLYQYDGQQLAVAVHHDGVVVSIGYAGHLAHAVWLAPPTITQVCQVLQTLCCTGTGAPLAPDIESCKNVIKYCTQEQDDAVCDCLVTWCQQNPPIPAACNLWITCCFGTECDPPPPPPPAPPVPPAADQLMDTIVNLLQYRLDNL